MKKTKAAKRRSAKKASGGPRDFDEYLATVPDSAGRMLKQMRSAIRTVVPREATETISYRIPAFQHNGIIVWYAAFAKHCSLFPTAAVIETFKEELKAFAKSKGTIQFGAEKPLPVGLIKKMVKARLAQMERQKRA